MPDPNDVAEPQDPNLVPNVDPGLGVAPAPDPEDVSPVFDPTPPTEPTSHKPAPTPIEGEAFGEGEADDDQEKMRHPKPAE